MGAGGNNGLCKGGRPPTIGGQEDGGPMGGRNCGGGYPLTIDMYDVSYGAQGLPVYSVELGGGRKGTIWSRGRGGCEVDGSD